MSDANLRQIFRKHLPLFDWQSVETWSTGRGVPDLNFCYNGVEGWIECKRTLAWKVNITPEQIGWIERRCRHGGRVFIAVRRMRAAGPRLGPAVDELYLLPGMAARSLNLQTSQPSGWAWFGGPSGWDWSEIKSRLSA